MKYIVKKKWEKRIVEKFIQGKEIVNKIQRQLKKNTLKKIQILKDIKNSGKKQIGENRQWKRIVGKKNGRKNMDGKNN